MTKPIIYFDNAATSWPKPAAVLSAINHFLTESGGNPGRSGHQLAMAAGDIIMDCREALATMFGCKNPMHTVFTANATMSLNMAIKGLLVKDSHVIVSSIEHNSVIRPLQQLQQAGLISYSVWQINPQKPDDLSGFQALIRNNTRLAVISHSSNVNGLILPIKAIGKICHSHRITFLVDAAQSAGTLPICMQDDNIDLLALTGHKGLYGPPGTGALIINDNFDYTAITPLITGGTGSLSSDFEQPSFLPDRLESGTPNGCGIAGLLAGLKYVQKSNPENIRKIKQQLADYFIRKSRSILGTHIVIYSNDQLPNSGVVSFNLPGYDAAEISTILSDDYLIMSRAGLHCAPLAHKTFKSYPAGSLRFSFSVHNSENEIDTAVEALKNICKI